MAAAFTYKYKVVVNKLPAAIIGLPAASNRFVRMKAELGRDMWRDRMFDAPRGGATYTYQSRPYTASAPGEPPAVKSGAYLESIYARRIGVAHYVIGTDLDYPATLEFGGVSIAPRPVVGPLAQELREQLTDGFAEILMGTIVL